MGTWARTVSTRLYHLDPEVNGYMAKDSIYSFVPSRPRSEWVHGQGQYLLVCAWNVCGGVCAPQGVETDRFKIVSGPL